MHRLCFCTGLRYCLPILLDRTDVRRLRDEDYLPCSQGRHPVINVFRDRFIWLDGNFSDCHLQLAHRNEYHHVLVDDADRHVSWSLDGDAGK